jgi:cobalt transporter subunit CbtA
MIQRVLAIALIAGVIAGLSVSAIQMVKVIPLILEAETYETAAQSAPSDNAHSHTHEEEWTPENGVQRTLFTMLSNIITGVGFALLLCAGIVLRGHSIDLKTGLMWGGAGFIAFSLMPSLGLPPELPGIDAADLNMRQIWWVLTVLFSAVGLALLAFKQGWFWKGGGLLFIAMPHLSGAPHLMENDSNTAAALAVLSAEFAIASVVTSALFWMIIGGTSGWLFQRYQNQT